jgi:predicted O-methyltransferase YrrM
MIATLKRRIDGWRYRRHYSFPTISLDDLVRGRQPLILDLRDWDSDLRAGDFIDSLTIASIARALEPALYWEIGTGDGRTALLIARNTPDTSLICTLDPGYPEDAVKGSVFHARPEAAKIRQFGDYSERFDFTPWHGKAGLVFVDGSHEFEHVLNDSEVAFKLLAPDGWILWHDVAMDTPDVSKALKQCSRADHIEAIAGTRYAFYSAPSEK